MISPGAGGIPGALSLKAPFEEEVCVVLTAGMRFQTNYPSVPNVA